MMRVMPLVCALLGFVSVASAKNTERSREPLEKEEIRGAILPHMSEVKACYRSAAASKPDLKGRVLVEFTISDSGGVDNATVQSSDLNDKVIEDCVVRKVLSWDFPKPRGGASVVVAYPFSFKPEPPTDKGPPPVATTDKPVDKTNK